MNVESLVTDNVAELLFKIIEFTQSRQKIITQNINNMRDLRFVPKDLMVGEFTQLLCEAIDEHIRNRRLVLRDTENIKFETGGNFTVRAVVDRYAQKLLEDNPDEYLELQANKLLENSLNQRVAAELLRQKQGMVSMFD